MSCTGTSGCICGCCAGTTVETPQASNNRAGLSSISYRVGAWSTFKESMLARLSSFDYPALNALKTRDDDDFTIAFLDATSVVLDILTFYQERLANESYLRTAGQLQSLIELSRLIGYQPSPGVSAACYVAFTLKTAPGQAPDPTAPAIIIPQGTQMQSVPAQGQKPQTFETSGDIPAKPGWNALPVQTGEPWNPLKDDRSVYLQGTATQLQIGDLVLIVGDERTKYPASEIWDIREITTVQPNGLNNVTYVEWSEGLVTPPSGHPRFFAFRQRGSLFGYNAVNPLLLAPANLTGLQTAGLVTPQPSSPPPPPFIPEWIFLAPGTQLIDLDSIYTKLASGGWITLIRPDSANPPHKPAGAISLYQIQSITTMTRSAYGNSGKITRAAVDTATNLSDYYTNTRQTSALIQSEELQVPLQPLLFPLYGSSIDLQDLRPDLATTKVIAITGKRQKVRVTGDAKFSADDRSVTDVALEIGSILTITSPGPLLQITASQWRTGGQTLSINVEDSSGRPGVLEIDLTHLALAPSDKNDPYVSECALVIQMTSSSGSSAHTVITLDPKSPLMNCYERQTTTINANVVLATNGQSASEILGNGSASTPNQSFVLKQSPITYIQAPTPTGRQSTLQVQVSGVKWSEVPTLYQQASSSQVFTTQYRSDGTTEVLFGDGVEGSTLPTGQNNLQANYRIGTGAQGNVAAGSLTTLVDRPLGVSGVTNPQSATGGQDPQTVDDVRATASQTVLTLGRAVSIADYQNFASTFAGISKAYAIWVPSGPGRGVFLTVAGVNGEALPPSNSTLQNLTASLKSYGNPLVPVVVVSFLETLFGLSADVKYDPLRDQPTVEAAVRQALSQSYSFANRDFGEGVSADEIASVVQAVPGVVAVNVKEIHLVATSAAGDLGSSGSFTIPELNAWLAQQVTLQRPVSDSLSRICPYLPVPSLTSAPSAAEILVLDPDPHQVTLGEMK
ncbi:MAG TPA: putative baseplate assembly protein [Candidatus Angelobacter sp.]|nr:putative baseplate assembly protein [Candidatus Angelobacter sp.]